MAEFKNNRITTVGLVLCLIAAVGPFAVAAYVNRSGMPIKFVVPVGFRGEFSIVKDRTNGQDLKLHYGVWVFEIPESGVLVVNDDYPFFMWHQETYVYSDGRTARVESLGTQSGVVQTGPHSSKGSTEYDGTTHRWKVLDAR